MLTLLVFGSVVALCCWGLSYLTAGLWPYCVPATLAADVLWLHLLDWRNRRIAWRIVGSVPDLFFIEERRMLLANPSLLISAVRPVRGLERYEFTSMIGAVEVVAFIGAAVSAILLAWVPMLLYVSLTLYGLLGPLATAFSTYEERDNMWRAADRCHHRLHPKRRPHRYVQRQSVPAAAAHYVNVLMKLLSVPELL